MCNHAKLFLDCVKDTMCSVFVRKDLWQKSSGKASFFNCPLLFILSLSVSSDTYGVSLAPVFHLLGRNFTKRVMQTFANLLQIPFKSWNNWNTAASWTWWWVSLCSIYVLHHVVWQFMTLQYDSIWLVKFIDNIHTFVFIRRYNR